MSAVVTLFDPSTGVRVNYVDDYLCTCPGDDDLYMWLEGNWSCDCNKRLFMARAGAPGYVDDASFDTPCGDTIVLEQIVADDGRVIYP